MAGPTRQRERSVESEEEEETEHGCPECESTDLVHDGEELVCDDCGLVIEEDQIDRGPEWLKARQIGRAHV